MRSSARACWDIRGRAQIFDCPLWGEPLAACGVDAGTVGGAALGVGGGVAAPIVRRGGATPDSGLGAPPAPVAREAWSVIGLAAQGAAPLVPPLLRPPPGLAMAVAPLGSGVFVDGALPDPSSILEAT